MPASTKQALTHLERLEAGAIHIMREMAAEAEKPVMLYSATKITGQVFRNLYLRNT